MINTIRQKILGFINSDEDVPVLAGVCIGVYMMLFYYSRNFGLANSLEQLLFFTGYYLVLPSVVLSLGYWLLEKIRHGLGRQFLFAGFLAFLAYFLFELLKMDNCLLLSIVIVAAVFLSFWLKQYYKLLIVLVAVMALFNLKPLAGTAYKFVTASNEWKKLPDDIENANFTHKPNIYYIQPDGYASFSNLKERYNADNSRYEAFLQANGFSLYRDYRSNYSTTLLSNAATFSMRHHYAAPVIEAYTARSIIVGENPVLEIFRKNGYTTSFITERPYLLMNRPQLGYDRCNTPYSTIPFMKDGLEVSRDVFADLKHFMEGQKDSGNFYFVEKFNPGHIHGREATSLGAVEEQKLYLSDLKKANVWLKEMVSHILLRDPKAIVIIGADHGGYLGFDHTGQSTVKTDEEHLISGIFGAQLAIRWNNPTYKEYDRRLITGINLFRTLFAFLSEDKNYLKQMEEDASYISLTEPRGVYKYIDGQGQIVFEKK